MFKRILLRQGVKRFFADMPDKLLLEVTKAADDVGAISPEYQNVDLITFVTDMIGKFMDRGKVSTGSPEHLALSAFKNFTDGPLGVMITTHVVGGYLGGSKTAHDALLYLVNSPEFKDFTPLSGSVDSDIEVKNPSELVSKVLIPSVRNFIETIEWEEGEQNLNDAQLKSQQSPLSDDTEIVSGITVAMMQKEL